MDPIQKLLSEHPSFGKGAIVAKAEIANGQLGWREHGKIVPWWDEFARELWDSFQIRYSVVGGGITLMEVAAEAAGYNQEMESEIIRRFGTNVIESTFRELERKRKKRK